MGLWSRHGTSYLRKPFEQAYQLQDQKGPWTTWAFPPSPKFYNWIHMIPSFPHPNPKHLAHFWFTASALWLALTLSLTCPCCSRVWPMWRQQMPNCNEKSFLFYDRNKNLKHWEFHSRASAREVSRPWELPVIQLSSKHLKATLSNVLAPNSAEFTSHYPLASAVLSPLALLTCMILGG